MKSFSNHKPLFERKPTSHKGDFARVGIIAGSKTMIGAAILTAMSALRTGAGVVHLYTIPESAEMINIMYPELIVHGCLDPKRLSATHDSFFKLLQSHKLDVIAVGPGLGKEAYLNTFIKGVLHFVSKHHINTIIDADALNVIKLQWLEAVPSNLLVLTPHPGEFKRLFFELGKQYNDTDLTREQLAKNASKLIRQVIVLKGHHTIVSKMDTSYMNETGNPGMATAGSGDVLTGVITALVGQEPDIYESAVLATLLHGISGDIAFEKRGIGLIASDIMNCIGEAFFKISDLVDGDFNDFN